MTTEPARFRGLRRLVRAVVLGSLSLLAILGLLWIRLLAEGRRREQTLLLRAEKAHRVMRELRARIPELAVGFPAPCLPAAKRLSDIGSWLEDLHEDDISSCLTYLHRSEPDERRKVLDALLTLRAAIPDPREVFLTQRVRWESYRFALLISPETRGQLEKLGVAVPNEVPRCGTKRRDEPAEQGAFSQWFDEWKERSYRRGGLCEVALRLLWGRYETHLEKALLTTDMPREEREQVLQRARDSLGRFQWVLREGLGGLSHGVERFHLNRMLLDTWLYGTAVDLYYAQEGKWPTSLTQVLPRGYSPVVHPYSREPLKIREGVLQTDTGTVQGRSVGWSGSTLRLSAKEIPGAILRKHDGYYQVILLP